MTEEARLILEKLSEMDTKLSEMDTRFDKVDTRLSEMDGKIQEMDGKIQEMDGKIQKMDDKIQKMDGKVLDVQLTLENEINRKIHIIAEGHLDLSRKLDDALRVGNEKEMVLIRVTRLENEVRRLDKRIDVMAAK